MSRSAWEDAVTEWEQSESTTPSTSAATVKGPLPGCGCHWFQHIQTSGHRQNPARTLRTEVRADRIAAPKYNPGVDPLDLEEYRQLRATIRERGSLRLVLFVATLITWAILAGLVAAVLSLPLASLLSLVLLMAGFEAVHAVHVSVERIGRYLYVRYESGTGRRFWEGTIATFGTGHRPSTRPADAVFSLIFLAAIFINVLIATLGATMPELAAIGALHGIAGVRVVSARRAASKQRAEDQKRFEEILK